MRIYNFAFKHSAAASRVYIKVVTRQKRGFRSKLVDIFCVLSRLLPHLIVHRSAVFSDNARFCGTYCIPARVIKLDDTSSKTIVQRIRGDFTRTFVNIERAIVLFAWPLISHSSETFRLILVIQIEFDTNQKKIKFQ